MINVFSGHFDSMCYYIIYIDYILFHYDVTVSSRIFLERVTVFLMIIEEYYNLSAVNKGQHDVLFDNAVHNIPMERRFDGRYR